MQLRLLMMTAAERGRHGGQGSLHADQEQAAERGTRAVAQQCCHAVQTTLHGSCPQLPRLHVPAPAAQLTGQRLCLDGQRPLKAALLQDVQDAGAEATLQSHVTGMGG